MAGGRSWERGQGVAPGIIGEGLILSEPPKPVKCLSFGNFFF